MNFRDVTGQRFTYWFVDWPSTHVNAGQTVEVMPRFVHEAEVKRLRDERDQLRDALAELVRLKDGPRDDAYRAAKDAAWDAGRAALKMAANGGVSP